MREASSTTTTPTATTTDAAAMVAQRVLFIHVMKTGGSTLVWHLRENFAPDELYPRPGVDVAEDASKPMTFRHLTIRYLRTIPDERRRRIRVYAGHFPYMAGEVLGGDLTTMTILRDPVERAISLLRQWCRNRPLASLTLEDAYEDPEVFGRLLHNHQTKVFSMTTEDEPTGYMQLIDIDESRLTLARDNLAQVDIVGLTERYDDFLDRLTERFGWRVKREVRANVAPAEDALSGNESLRRRIAEDNAIDVEFYEYARELVDARQRRRPMHT